jgi:hypothetical protein
VNLVERHFGHRGGIVAAAQHQDADLVLHRAERRGRWPMLRPSRVCCSGPGGRGP